MAKAKKIKLLSFTLPNKVGQLSAVGELIADVNVIALCAVETGDKAEFKLATEKNGKAKKALAALGVEVKEEEAVCIEMANKPGRLHRAAKKLADAQVGIQWSWAAAFCGKTSACVLVTSDNRKAIAAINA